ncbi:hypothetical protein GJ496_005010 [Pomphorhynchus laevis]|nr:hypothetical protein GJ496_005010 [Pomphorhynchus laevis]
MSSRILKNIESQQQFRRDVDGLEQNSNFTRYYRSRFFSSKGPRYTEGRQRPYSTSQQSFINMKEFDDGTFYDPAIVKMIRNDGSFNQASYSGSSNNCYLDSPQQQRRDTMGLARQTPFNNDVMLPTNTRVEYSSQPYHRQHQQSQQNNNARTKSNRQALSSNRQAVNRPTGFDQRRHISSPAVHNNNRYTQFNSRMNNSRRRMFFDKKYSPRQQQHTESCGLPDLHGVFGAPRYLPNVRNNPPYRGQRYKQFLVVYDYVIGFYYLPIKGDIRNLAEFTIPEYHGRTKERRYSYYNRDDDYESSMYRRTISNRNRNRKSNSVSTRLDTNVAASNVSNGAPKNRRNQNKSDSGQQGKNTKIPVQQQEETNKQFSSSNTQKDRRRFNRKSSVQNAVKKLLNQITEEIDEEVKSTPVKESQT